MFKNFEYQKKIFGEKLLKESQLNSIQFMRIVACLAVVVFHIEGYINRTFITDYPYSFFTFGKMGVDTFFILSGFIIPYSIFKREKSQIKFLYNRFIRIYPSYIFVILFFISSTLLISKFQLFDIGTELSFKKTYLSFLFNLGNSTQGYFQVAWTLFYEMCFYIIFSFMTSRFKSISKTKLFYLAIPSLQLFFLILGKFYLADFLLGISIFLILINPKSFNFNNAYFIYLLSSVFVHLFFDYNSSIIGLLFIGLLLLEYFRRNLFDNLTIKKIADASFSIYIIQEIIISPTIKILNILFNRMGLSDYSLIYISSVTGTLFLTILCGYIFRNTIEIYFYKLLLDRNFKGIKI